MKKIRYLWAILSVFWLSGLAGAETDFAPEPDRVRPLLVGHLLPELVLQSADGQVFDFQAKNEKKPLVVVFYRGHW